MLTQDQFTYLVQKYIDTVFRVALHYTKNPADAEDIVQNTFLKLYQQQKDFQSEEHIRAWLIRVAVNEGKKHLRSPWRSHVPYEEYAASLHFPAPEQREVWEEVMALPRKYRLPIYLHYYEGYPISLIAQLHNTTEGAITMRLHRARTQLRTILEGVCNV